MGEEDLRLLIGGCKRQDRLSQKALYKAFYGFAMGICLRYANNRYDASEVLNRGFYKVFSNLDRYDPSKPFKAWLGMIMRNVSIDFYRSNLKIAFTDDLDEAEHISDGNLADKNLGYDDLIRMVQQLPNAYRTVFNLFAIEGHSHEEIAEILNINVGTSKSNLHKARQKLKLMIFKSDQPASNVNYNNGLNYNPITAIQAIKMNGIFLNKGFGE